MGEKFIGNGAALSKQMPDDAVEVAPVNSAALPPAIRRREGLSVVSRASCIAGSCVQGCRINRGFEAAVIRGSKSRT